jgi:hypothetical protein
METPVKTVSISAVEMALVNNDLSKLSPSDRMSYYKNVCDSVGLNPLTQPFSYILLNGKLTLYAKRDATDQLRKNHNISINIVSREKIDDVYIVIARAKTQDGREDESIGSVSIGNLKGDALANAYMKCETKAKRRVTLSICGLGMLDDSETESIKDAVKIDSNSFNLKTTQENKNSTNQTPRNTQPAVAKNNQKQETNRPVGNTSNVAKVKNHAPSPDEIKASKPGAARETPKVTEQQQPVSEREASPATEDSFPEDLTSATDTSLDENFIDNEMKDAIIQHGANHGWEPDDIGHLIYSKFRLLGWSKVQIKHYNEIWLAIEKKDG